MPRAIRSKMFPFFFSGADQVSDSPEDENILEYERHYERQQHHHDDLRSYLTAAGIAAGLVGIFWILAVSPFIH